MAYSDKEINHMLEKMLAKLLGIVTETLVCSE